MWSDEKRASAEIEQRRDASKTMEALCRTERGVRTVVNGCRF